jgi:hypothetical protein
MPLPYQFGKQQSQLQINKGETSTMAKKNEKKEQKGLDNRWLDVRTGAEEDLLAKLKDDILNHYNFERAYNLVTLYLRSHKFAPVIFLVGPAGAGKTELLKILERAILDHEKETMAKDKNYLPCIHVKLPAPEAPTFSVRDLYEPILKKAQEPLIDKKIKTWPKNHDKPLVTTEKDRFPVLRDSVIDTFKNRRVLVCLVDEGQHFFRMGNNPRRFEERTDVLKFLSEASQTTIIMAGPYELINACKASSQLARRVLVVHFDRYTMNTIDVARFTNIVHHFAERMPFENAMSLVDKARDLCERTSGSVGILKPLLVRASEFALLGKTPHIITDADIDAGELEIFAREKIEDDAVEGRQRFAIEVTDTSTDGSQTTAPAPVVETKKSEKKRTTQTKKDEKKKGNGRRGKRKPGVRNPVADPAYGDILV